MEMTDLGFAMSVQKTTRLKSIYSNIREYMINRGILFIVQSVVSTSELEAISTLIKELTTSKVLNLVRYVRKCLLI